MRETTVERRLIELVKKEGGICVKVPPVVAGTPDRLVLLPGGRMYLVETKAPGGRLRPIQAVWHSKAAKVGIFVSVLTSTEEVVEWMRDKAGGG